MVHHGCEDVSWTTDALVESPPEELFALLADYCRSSHGKEVIVFDRR